jgi:hypothetical protein
MTKDEFISTIQKAFNHLIESGWNLPLESVNLENCGFDENIMVWMTFNQEYCVRWSSRDKWTFFKDFDDARCDEETGDNLIEIIEKVMKREREYKNGKSQF